MQIALERCLEVVCCGEYPSPCCLASQLVPPRFCLNPQVKSHEYVQLTNGIVEALSPEEIPRVRSPLPELVIPFLWQEPP